MRRTVFSRSGGHAPPAAHRMLADAIGAAEVCRKKKARDMRDFRQQAVIFTPISGAA
jgi:hypothetical protein